MRMRILYDPADRASSIADNFDRLAEAGEVRGVKSGRRTCAGVIRFAESDVFVKRVVAQSWANGILDRIRGSRALRSLRSAAVMSSKGFAVPKPLGTLEVLSRGACMRSYFIAEALTGAKILSRFALSDGRNFRRRVRISKALAAEIRRLHDAGLYTRDMQETNLMMAPDEAGGFIVYFVDLEDFRSVRRISWRNQMLNLVHLDRSIGRFLSRSQRLRFLYNYLHSRPEPAKARAIVSELASIVEKIEARKGRMRPTAIRLDSGRTAPVSTRSGS